MYICLSVRATQLSFRIKYDCVSVFQWEPFENRKYCLCSLCEAWRFRQVWWYNVLQPYTVHQLHHILLYGYFLFGCFPCSKCSKTVWASKCFWLFFSNKVPNRIWPFFFSTSTTELALNLDLFLFLLHLHSSRDVTQSCHLLSNLGRNYKCFIWCSWDSCSCKYCRIFEGFCIEVWIKIEFHAPLICICTIHVLMLIYDSRLGHYNIRNVFTFILHIFCTLTEILRSVTSAQKIFYLELFPIKEIWCCITSDWGTSSRGGWTFTVWFHSEGAGYHYG